MCVGPLRARLQGPARVQRGRVALFAAGLAALWLVEGTPFHDLGEIYLFSAHMTQHMVLCYAVPPLLIAGVPDWLWRRLLARPVVAPVVRVLTHPVVALGVFSLAFSLWHVPAIYQGALRNSLVHHIEHVIFIGTGLLLWWPVMSPLEEIPRLADPAKLIYLFVAPIAQFVVAAVLTFAQVPIYATYVAAPRISGLTPIGDQQLGGVIMKVGSLIAFGVPLARTFFRWYAATGGPDRPRHGTDASRSPAQRKS